MVLAIAALIILMVLVALPALQRNQRDQSRKTFQGKVASAVTTYSSNKRNNLPTSGASLSGYFDGSPATAGARSGDSSFIANASDGYADNQYFIRVSDGSGLGTPSTGVANIDVIQIYTGAKCNNTADAAIRGTARQAAVLMKMENGNAVVCMDV